MTEEKNILEIHDLKVSYGGIEAVKGVTLTVPEGKIVTLIGANGAGKSTILKTVSGIVRPKTGRILYNGEDITGRSPDKIVKAGIVLVPEGRHVFPNLTVKENIEVGAYLGSNPLDVDDLLHTLGLWEHKDKIPSQLSGGQQQRTSIGRAIVKNPDLLLCDEPTGALDYNTSKDILKLIEDVNRKYGNTIIIVTHNDAIKLMADRVIKLRDGMIRKEYTNETKTPAMELDW